jgi:hypothetical protein
MIETPFAKKKARVPRAKTKTGYSMCFTPRESRSLLGSGFGRNRANRRRNDLLHSLGVGKMAPRRTGEEIP